MGGSLATVLLWGGREGGLVMVEDVAMRQRRRGVHRVGLRKESRMQDPG